MIWLWLPLILPLAVALFFVIPPLLRRAPDARDTPNARNATTTNARDAADTPGVSGASDVLGIPNTSNMRDESGEEAAALRAFYLSQRAQLRRELDDGLLTAEAHALAEDELQRNLLEDATLHRAETLAKHPRAGLVTALVLILLIPAAAILLYLQLGDPRAASMIALADQPAAHQIDDKAAPIDMNAAVGALALHIRRDPGDIDGWSMLARSYEALGRYDDAVIAYQQLVQRLPQESPALYADLAGALVSANGGEPSAQADAALARALALQPTQPKALALSGMMAMRRGHPQEALERWNALQAILPPGSEASRLIQDNIAQARAMAGLPPAPAAPPASPASPALPVSPASPVSPAPVTKPEAGAPAAN